MHILNNRHEYGPEIETLQLLKPCTKGAKMNCWENIYIQIFHNHGLLVKEQQIIDINPLYNIVNKTKIIPHSTSTLAEGEHRETHRM